MCILCVYVMCILCRVCVVCMLYVCIVFMVEQGPNGVPSRGGRTPDGPREKEWSESEESEAEAWTIHTTERPVGRKFVVEVKRNVGLGYYPGRSKTTWCYMPALEYEVIVRF